MTAHVLPPAPPVRRPRVATVASAFASAAIVMLFIGMLGVYLSARAAVLATGSKWLPQGSTIPLQQPNTIFITLLMAVVAIQWAVNAVSRNDRVHAYLAFGLTLMLGLASIVMTSYLWVLMKLDIGSGPQGVLIYSITGAHVVLLGVAMIFTALVALRTLGGQFDARQHDGVAAVALFWDAMVFVYALIWIIIYVTK